MKAGPTGSLFGSVTPTDIADELWKTAKVRVDRRKIGIDNIKRIGRYEVPIDLFQDVRVEVKTLVVPEGGELPSESELAAMEAAELAGGRAGRSRCTRGRRSRSCLAEEEPPAEAEEPTRPSGARARLARRRRRGAPPAVESATRSPRGALVAAFSLHSACGLCGRTSRRERVNCPQAAPSDAPASMRFPCKWRKKTCS